MRKLLVASQKGGVGKTTTSMNLAAATALTGTRVLLLDADPLSNISTALNLAQHPQRILLRQQGIDLPGVFVPNIVPGLDVLSPYDEGSCSDEDLARLLQVLAEPTTQRCYGCMIVDVPPFLGGNPAQLISSCDDFLLVMRAETLAYRTLPAFLELVQRSSPAGHVLPMRGILLTLPEGEVLGCRWERELRGRFGTRVLPEVIPHDETIGTALHDGRIGSDVHPDSPAGKQYHQLVDKLGLAAEGRATVGVEQVLRVLREGATGLGPSTPPAPVSAPAPAEVVRPTKKAAEETPLPVPPPEPVKPAASPPRSRRLPRPSETPRSARPERPLPGPSLPAPSPVRMKVVPAQMPVADEVPASPAPAPATPQHTANALAQLWPLWILLGAVLGGGLRLVPLTASLLPILVGLGVALIVVVALFALAAQERAASGTREVKRPPSRAAKKVPARPEAPEDRISARLAALAGTSKRLRRDPDAN